MKGTKRRIICMAPVESVVGIVGKKNTSLYDPARYGGQNQMIGFVRKNTAANRFRVSDGTFEYHSEATKAAALLRQAKFRGVSQAAHARLQDPTKRQADEIAWRSQTKYATLWGYVFHEEWLVYED